MATGHSDAANTASEYYNSIDADGFYFEIWGGEDIHVGLYESPDESILEASLRTKSRIASLLSKLSQDSKVLDIGSGYGGAARYLAKTYGCRVTTLNLSKVQNERHRRMNAEQGLDHLIEVVDGSFEDIPFKDSSFDIVWSQDAILHSEERLKVIAEVSRVLTGAGEFVFTDPMQSDTCPKDVLEPILNRLLLNSLASPGFYQNAAQQHGLKAIRFQDLTTHLVTHYERVLQETQEQEEKLKLKISQEYINNMKKGLQYWIDGGKSGHLAWGIFHFRKE